MKIRLASELMTDSIVDGPGIRSVIWTQGCPHGCIGCHNPETHDFNLGFLKKVEDLKKEIASLSFQTGITFSGGDPFCQVEACLELAKFCKEKGLDIWCYTGYTYEKLLVMSKTNKWILEFLKNIDVLVDGKFILEQKSLDVPFRGSKNQRLIDVTKSLENQKVILYQWKNNVINTHKKNRVYI